MASAPHDEAVQRLEDGLLEQDRCAERYDGAIGTSSEASAYAQLRAAGARVAAHETFLHWVDDQSDRGLDASPFERLAEGRPASPG